MNSKIIQKTLILGTGGTIAGLASDTCNSSKYEAGQLGLTNLLESSGLSLNHLELQDIAQIDSKDMGPMVWKRLLSALDQAQHRVDIQAMVVTHGTDTLEETAFLLHAMGPWVKPVVLTCAMKPANAPNADGPGNLRDALWLAQTPGIPSVSVVCAQQVHDPLHLQKIRTDQDDAFSSGPSGVLGQMEQGQWTPSRRADSFAGGKPSLAALLKNDWPRVAWVTHHAGSDGQMVRALVSKGQPHLHGLVVAATGSGTVGIKLEAALLEAHQQGVVVWVSSRCAWGQAHFHEEKAWGMATTLSPAKALVALALHLMAAEEAQEARA